MSYAAPIPALEPLRLTQLEQLGILDTPHEEGFDAIVQLARRMFGCSIAYVSLVDRDRQWFKAQCGISLTETPREQAFCAYAILQPDIMVVEDMHQDVRFRDHPIVTGELGIRFYAGAPLRPAVLKADPTSPAVGTICIADARPRLFSEEDRETLRMLARLVEDQMSARVAAATLLKSSAEVQSRAVTIDRMNRQLRQAERMAGIGSWRLDLATQQVEWSDQVFAIHELPPGAAMALDQALGFYCGPDRQRIAASVERAVATGEAFDVECDLITATGTLRRVRSLGELELVGGVPAALIGVFQDVTDRFEQQQVLERSANLDSLTEVPNRRAFEARLAQICGGGVVVDGHALCLIDVDDFKIINDRHGHATGDALLKEIARRLAAAVPPDAMVARLGGDEFAILLRHVDNNGELQRLTDAIVTAAKCPFTVQGIALAPSISIGATLGRTASTADAMLMQADAALYAAKQAGRDRASVFKPNAGRQPCERVTVLNEVKAGLKERDFEAYYLPIVDLRTHVVRGWEALLRWNHPTRGVLRPAAFRPALEDPETSIAIDDFMMETGLAQMQAWLAAGVPVTCLGLNVSDAQLRRPDLVAVIKAQLARFDLTPDRLKLEVLETAFTGRSTHQVARTISHLAEYGVVSVLDDFGTGHASLTHLKQFRVERIKLDQSFTRSLGTNSRDEAIVRCMVGLGRDLGVRVTAEGIETIEQLRLLGKMGSDCVQGHLFARPMRASAVPKFLDRWYGGGAERLLGALTPAGAPSLRVVAR